MERGLKFTAVLENRAPPAAGPISLLEASIVTPLRTDGIRKYFSSILRNIADPQLRTFART
jgi:hypothetical protein